MEEVVKIKKIDFHSLIFGKIGILELTIFILFYILTVNLLDVFIDSKCNFLYWGHSLCWNFVNGEQTFDAGPYFELSFFHRLFIFILLFVFYRLIRQGVKNRKYSFPQYVFLALFLVIFHSYFDRIIHSLIYESTKADSTKKYLSNQWYIDCSKKLIVSPFSVKSYDYSALICHGGYGYLYKKYDIFRNGIGDNQRGSN